LTADVGHARRVFRAQPEAVGSPRVLQVVLSLDPGGTERLVLELVRRLRRDIPMAVCCLDRDGAWAADLRREGVTVTALGRETGFHPSLGRLVADLAGTHEATVLHCHHYSPFVYGCLARLWSPRLRIVFTEHGRLSDSGPSRKRRLANAVLARVPTAVFAVSNDLKDHLVAEGFRASAVEVLYNGVDLEPLSAAAARGGVRRQLGAREETLVVGTIARLDPVKDLATLLDAVARLGPGLDVLVVLIGDGPERKALEQLATSLGIADRVRFLGHRDDARWWLNGCDLYANSSISEGVSLTILEAMAAGLPIVATAVGGTPEVVPAACGRLVPSRDAAAIASAIRGLAADSSLRTSLGRAARTRVEQLFTLERMVEDYRRVYEGAA
jgi:glycosyltransferase involved in cell wall biosynthesis